MSYYARTTAMNSDGTPLFATRNDAAAEDETARLVEQTWGAELHRFGPLAPIDYYAIRHGRLVGLLELKTRSHASTKFPTVFLNVRKWLALRMASMGMGVPAVFVARFEDGARWIDVEDVDASTARMGGCLRVVKAASDVEPVIEVPVAEMRPIVNVRCAGVAA